MRRFVTPWNLVRMTSVRPLNEPKTDVDFAPLKAVNYSTIVPTSLPRRIRHHAPGGREYALALGAIDSQRFGLSQQIGERFRAHLLHNAPPMDLHGNFGQPEFRCYLLVQETRRYQSKNFPLARGQSVEKCLQVRDNLVCVAPLPISLNRRHYSVQHLLVAKWLGQEIDRSALHGPDAHRDIAMA